jgi:hypothetical protein
MTASAETLLRRYFELAAHPDTPAYFAQFAADAKVEDEGKVHHGIDAIRAWRAEVPLVSYTVHSLQPAAGSCAATVEIAGAFPGSPVTLTFSFKFAPDNRITGLTIRP